VAFVISVKAVALVALMDGIEVSVAFWVVVVLSVVIVQFVSFVVEIVIAVGSVKVRKSLATVADAGNASVVPIVVPLEIVGFVEIWIIVRVVIRVGIVMLLLLLVDMAVVLVPVVVVVAMSLGLRVVKVQVEVVMFAAIVFSGVGYIENVEVFVVAALVPPLLILGSNSLFPLVALDYQTFFGALCLWHTYFENLQLLPLQVGAMTAGG